MKPEHVILAALLASACVEERPPIVETTSLRVEVTDPTDLGSLDVRLPTTVNEADIKVSAIGADGEIDTGVSGEVDVYVQFLAARTRILGPDNLPRKITLTNGVSAVETVPLPPVYGPTVVWVEDVTEGGSFPAGVSPTLWFPEPKTRDLQKPRDEASLSALSTSPLQDRQVTVMGSRHGANGRLVVTSVYSQGYTVSDVTCADAEGRPPCTASDYDHMLVFSFSRPRDEMGRGVVPGQTIDGYAGAVTEFNGLTEMGFPQTFAVTPGADPAQADLARIPAPVTIQPSWLTTRIEFERNEAGPVQVLNGTVCPLDDDWDEFGQWKLDIGRGCGTPINVVTRGLAFDPMAHVGMQMSRVVGMLQPINIGTFNVWIMFPRGVSDLVQ